jgi:hypothetical protein
MGDLDPASAPFAALVVLLSWSTDPHDRLCVLQEGTTLVSLMTFFAALMAALIPLPIVTEIIFGGSAILAGAAPP